MSDKLKLLTVDELRMDEVGLVERVSGFALQDLMELDGAVPNIVIMALAYVTERRVKPKLKPDAYRQMNTDQFIRHLYARFEFDESDSNYEQWTVADLKAELGRRDLSTSGKKPELVERLHESDEESDDEDPTRAV